MDHDCPRIKPEALLQAMRSTPLDDGICVIGCFERRVTLRSQQVRALNLMYALHATGRLRADSRVAIIGGGAAGVTAAAAAARLGATQVILLEKGSELLLLQAYCHHRWLHPHVYDWPEGGSTDHDAGLPLLNWKTGKASEVATQIRDQFNSLDQRRHITVWYHVERLTRNGLGLSWSGRKEMGPNDKKDIATTPEKQFDLIVYAVGFGTEPPAPGQSSASGAHSYWQQDMYEQPAVGGGFTNYLVSGCGDGGLVDLLRVRIGHFHHEKIFQRYIEQPCSPNELDELREQLLGIESQARLQRGDPSVFLRLKYEALGVPEAVDAAILGELRTDTRADLHGLKDSPLTLGSSILNRFLVSRLLYSEYEGNRDRPIYRGGELETQQVNGLYKCRINKVPVDYPYDCVIVHHGPMPAIDDVLNIEDSRHRMRAFAELDITRDRLWPDGYYNPDTLRASWDGHGVRAEEAERLVKLVRSKLAWQMTDDALYLPLEPCRGTQIPVRLAAPTYDADLDEVNMVAYNSDMHKQRSDRWAEPYRVTRKAEEYLLHNLDYEARLAKVDRQDCKIGFAELDSNSFGNELGTPPIVVRPLNHLVTYTFNRNLAVARTKRLTGAEMIWRECLERFAEGPSFRMACPSQLFIELVLVTLDGDVPVNEKNVQGSVYTVRNDGRPVKTCGPERGSRWRGTIDTQDPRRAFYDIRSSIAGALADEYCIAMPGKAVDGTKPALQLSREPYFEVGALAIQCFHLNSALLGVCVLPVRTEELARHLRSLHTLRSSGGVIFGDNPCFISIADIDGVLARETGTTHWHGTALARLRILGGREEQMREAAAALQ